MLDHSALARADQPPAGIAAVRAVMAREDRAELPDAMASDVLALRKRQLWALWRDLDADTRAAFLAYATGGGDALHR